MVSLTNYMKDYLPQPGESNGAGLPVGLGLLAVDGHAEGIDDPT